MFPRRLQASFLFTCWQVECFAAAPWIKGWELQQDNPHTVWMFCAAGMAAVNKENGLHAVTKAPQWNVVMYNDKTKVYFLSPLSEWKGASLRQPALAAKELLPNKLRPRTKQCLSKRSLRN